MKLRPALLRPGLIALGLPVLLLTPTTFATLRIVSYNVDSADVGTDDNINGPFAGLPTVVQGIAAHHIGTNAQPIDVMGVEETNPTTLPNLVAAMNTIYGAGAYAYAYVNDPSTGGGGDGLIYNTKTVQIVASKVVGTASGSGAARAPLRYQIRPLGFGADSDFYMYVDHYKASSADEVRRNVEATTVRQDADALGPNAHVIYSGDFNPYYGSAEDSYATLTAAGNGRAYDPVAANYVSTWVNSSSTWKYLYSLSTDSLSGRYDMQLVTAPVLNQPGLQLAADTSDPYTGNFPSSKYAYAYEVFGNNGTTAYHGATNGAGNTSLSDLPNATAVLNALMQFDANNNFVGSDHLPVVADYNLVGITPLWLAWTGGTGNWSTAAKWQAGVVPNFSTTEARIDSTINAGPASVTLDQNASVKDLIVGANGALTINAGNTLTINGPTASTFAGTLTNSGTLAVGAAVTNSGTFTQPAGGTLAVTSGTFTNSGTAAIGGAQQWAAGTTFTNSAGSATFNSDAGGAASPSLTVNATGGSVAFNASQHLLALNATGSAQVTLPNGPTTTTLSTKGLLISGTATVDLAGNVLALSYTGSTPADTIRGYLHNGSLFSSPANGDPQDRLAIGYVDNGSTVTAHLTYLGDANLDGKINADDYSLIDRSFAKALTNAHWSDGDFNYDGVIDQNDYLLIDRVYTQQSGPLSPVLLAAREAQFGPDYASELAASVPEPAAIGVTVGLGLVLGRRRTRRR